MLQIPFWGLLFQLLVAGKMSCYLFYFSFCPTGDICCFLFFEALASGLSVGTGGLCGGFHISTGT